MNNFVSIITPAYKAASHLLNAVQSVLVQTHQHWEMLIIADDHYDYASLLKRNDMLDERIRFFNTQACQSGPNIARNIGLRHAKGNWIAPLDADDIYYPTRLEKLLEAASESGLSLDNVFISTGSNYQNKERVMPEGKDKIYFSDFEQSLVPLLLLFRRDLISQGWDEDIQRGADTLFNLRALEKAGFAAFVSEPLHEYRVHNNSLCHAPGSDELFIQAYQHTLNRLSSDGLGFDCAHFRNKVIKMIADKEKINALFNTAIRNGYQGNYQEFVAQEGFR